MQGERDPFDFSLAQQLGMTVEQMLHTVGNAEYLQWRAYTVYSNAQLELAAKKPERNMTDAR